MKVLIIGSGGREHAICWALSKSPSVKKIYCAPVNAGISKIAECVDISVEDIVELAKFAKTEKMDFTVVGPEVPLCMGIADLFEKEGLRIFGPKKASAILEGSKIYSKRFMKRYGIPTAEFEVFEEKKVALDFLKKNFDSSKGIVVKADGLAAGKGVIVAKTIDEAEKAIEDCFSGHFGEAGKKVLLEEVLIGEEASILALCDGKTIIPLASSQDHKRVGDGDNGPNTGGMGAYSPAPVVSARLMEEIQRTIFTPFLSGLNAEKLSYCGIIYAGVMVTKIGAKILEFNVRFGDPETEAVLPRLKSDLAKVMLSTIEQKLSALVLEWDERTAVSVVMASEGYPGAYQKGYEISGISDAENEGAIVFHAGTKLKDGKIINSGGRVLVVTALGSDISEAIKNTYKAVSKIKWDGAFYRKDIGQKALLR